MKKRNFLTFGFCLLSVMPFFNLCAQKTHSDNGDGTYTNPVIPADFPDPDVVRVGDTYYMVSTTMFVFPGVPIIKSHDLVNWEYCSNAVPRFDFDKCYDLDSCNRYGHGQWATSLKYHNGKFYLLFITLNEGGFMCTASKAEGPWKVTHLPKGFYDPGLFFDDNGKIYVAQGYNKISITEVDSNLVAIGPDSLVYTGDIRRGLEGTHVYKIDGYYFLYCTYGGRDGIQVALRSKNIYGPYEQKVVLRDTTRGVNFGVHQGALLQTQTGEWWTMLFVDSGPFGRFPSLHPVTWVDGWPMVGVDGKGVITYKKPNVGKIYPVKDFPLSDEFNSNVLGKQWGWNHNPDPLKWSFTKRPGYLRLTTVKVVGNLREARNTLTQRPFTYYSDSIPAIGIAKLEVGKMKEGDLAGLAMFQDPYAYIAVKQANGSRYVIMVNNGKTIDSVTVSNTTLYLRTIASNSTGKASFEYSVDNKTFIPLGNQLSMRFNLSIFTGNKFCLFNYATKETGGYVDIDWFRVKPMVAPAGHRQVISSPDKKLVVTVDIANAIYTIAYKGKVVLKESKLGVTREDEDFSQHLALIKAVPPVIVKDNYLLVTAKKKKINYTATEQTLETKTVSGKKMNIVFRVSDDGVAFRYEFPDKSADVKKITAEATTFHFNDSTRAWLQPKTEAQSGFEHSNPSYEAHYTMDIPVGTPSPGNNGWIYPALFNYNNVWMLITEASLGRTYCGTALQQYSPGGEYKINFPEPPEVFTNGTPTLNPESTLPWKTPWRIIAIGDMKTIEESTLGTDLAFPAKKMDASFIKPGKSSWSWILKKDDSTVFSVQKRYIDFAADMKWQYCLVDANWDATIGYDSVKLLADYGKPKKVGILLWYNSAGSWNTVKFTPKDKLLTHESRAKEFARLQSMGIKGIKVDFFAGDGQSMINYYQDILEDAAVYHLLVNFHGATLPRGLHRTYPNLMTTEAVHGYEMITFSAQAANQEPSHMVMSAMVRNVFDPMDFTPMNLYKIPRIKRVTTSAFELATAVVLVSGIQHYAESPDGMSYVPEYVKDFLRQLPDSWDDTKFIDGYPGKLFIVARKAGNKWYVAGINGEDIPKTLTLDLSFLRNRKGRLITGDGIKNEPSFNLKQIVLPASGKIDITLAGNDGFTAVFE